MDYSELVKALRETATFTKFDDLLSKREQKLESLAFDAADAIEELMKNLDMASQELSWTISYAMHLMRDIDELHDMVNEVYYDEL